MTSVDTMRLRLMNRMAALLKQCQDAENRQAEMAEVSNTIWKNMDLNVQINSTRVFLHDLFGNGVGQRLAEIALEREVDLESAKSPSDLIQRLLLDHDLN